MIKRFDYTTKFHEEAHLCAEALRCAGTKVHKGKLFNKSIKSGKSGKSVIH